MNNPLVSVVIPTHNRIENVKRAVKSVFEQTYPNIEVIIVDDASTEDISVIREAFDKPITIIRNEQSLRAQKSRLRGAQAAKGEYVALLDSDDWMLPEKIATQVQYLQENNNRLVSSRFYLFN